MPGKQDSYLLNMGERRDSRWVITLVFFLYSNYARHFTRLRHTLKGVTLHCFSLLCVVDIGWMFCRMSHCFGLFFYSGQFKSCFPHHGNPWFTRVSDFFMRGNTQTLPKRYPIITCFQWRPASCLPIRGAWCPSRDRSDPAWTLRNNAPCFPAESWCHLPPWCCSPRRYAVTV